jgi:hypothetical protein
VAADGPDGRPAGGGQSDVWLRRRCPATAGDGVLEHVVLDNDFDGRADTVLDDDLDHRYDVSGADEDEDGRIDRVTAAAHRNPQP